eukprot:361896-Chlamydomonas_euryale.AAC.5
MHACVGHRMVKATVLSCDVICGRGGHELACSTQKRGVWLPCKLKGFDWMCGDTQPAGRRGLSRRRGDPGFPG